MSDPKSPADSQGLTRTGGHAGGESTEDEPFEPRTLGDFHFLREIGRGGMGVVFEARQLSLNRRVALKVLPPAIGLSKQATQRFEREAHAAAKLHHTNIVPVYAIGEEQGSHYYAMELVEGQSLDHILSDLAEHKSNPLMEATVARAAADAMAKPRPSAGEATSTSLSDTSTAGREWFDAVAKLISDVADALHYAHGRGIIHRDVKPANLLLSQDDRLMVSDFGLARIVQEPGMTISGSFMGTPAYMSPEQIAVGRMKIDHRTDVYSLGAVLYEMLALRRPFAGESREEVVAGIMTKDPRPPRRFNGRIPIDLETICLKALEKDPDRRYQSAGEMAQDLRQYQHGGLIAAQRAGLLRRTWKSIRRHPLAATVFTAALAVVILGGLAWHVMSLKSVEEMQHHLADARFAQSQGEHNQALNKAGLVLAMAPDHSEARLIRARSLLYIGREQEALAEGQAMVAEDSDNWVGHLIVVAAARGGAFYGGDIEPHVEAVERLAPDTAEAHTLRSLTEDSANEALVHLNQALDLDPGNAEALMYRLFRQMELKNFQAALADADRFIIARSRSPRGPHLKAVAYWFLHDTQNALKELNHALEIDPDYSIGYAVRGNLYGTLLSDQENALADISRAIELAPDIAANYMVRGWHHFSAGRTEEALADAERAEDLEPDDPMYMQLQVAIAFRLGDHEEVRAILDRARTVAETWTDPDLKSMIHTGITFTLLQLGDHAGALAEADRAVELEPDKWWPYTMRARMRKLLGNPEGAEADCDQAAATAADEPQDLMNRAMHLSNFCDRKERAIEDLTRAVELAPWWADAYVALGAQFAYLGKFDEALINYDKAVELADQWPEAYRNRTIALTRLGRYGEALADCDRRVKLTPEDAEVHSHQGGILFEMNRIEEALEAREKALAMDPSVANHYIGRAGVLAHLGRCRRVEEDLARALELEPGMVENSANLAWLHAFDLYYGCPDLYSLETALRPARKTVELNPNGEAGQRTLGVLLYRSGHYEEAIQHQLRASATYAGQAFDLFFLAMEHWQLGRKVEARDYYDRAVAWMNEHNPEHPLLKHFRQEASELMGL